MKYFPSVKLNQSSQSSSKQLEHLLRNFLALITLFCPTFTRISDQSENCAKKKKRPASSYVLALQTIMIISITVDLFYTMSGYRQSRLIRSDSLGSATTLFSEVLTPLQGMSAFRESFLCKFPRLITKFYCMIQMSNAVHLITKYFGSMCLGRVCSPFD